MTAIVLFSVFIGLIVLRTPVIMAIGVAVIGALVLAGFGGMLWIVPMKALEAASNTSLLAIPFFCTGRQFDECHRGDTANF